MRGDPERNMSKQTVRGMRQPYSILNLEKFRKFRSLEMLNDVAKSCWEHENLSSAYGNGSSGQIVDFADLEDFDSQHDGHQARTEPPTIWEQLRVILQVVNAFPHLESVVSGSLACLNAVWVSHSRFFQGYYLLN